MGKMQSAFQNTTRYPLLGFAQVLGVKVYRERGSEVSTHQGQAQKEKEMLDLFPVTFMPAVLLWFLTIDMQLSLLERLIVVSLLVQPAIFHETHRKVISLRPLSLSNSVAIGQAAEKDRHTDRKRLVSLQSFLKNHLLCPSRMLVFGTKEVEVKK